MEKTIGGLTPETLEERRKGIGGSDVAAILGLSKFKTPLDVYHDKLFGAKTEMTQPMMAGILLEDTIANWYMLESNRKVLRDNKIRYHKDIPYLLANIDRIILPTNGEGRGILEIKTAGLYAARFWEDEPPMDYTLQLQHYLDVTGYTWGEFAVLVGGQDFRRYYVERDEELIQLKNERLTNFWENHVLKAIPPDPINEKDLAQLYARHTEGKVIEAAEDTRNTIYDLKTLKEKIKQLEEEEAQLTERLKLALGDAEALVYLGEPMVTWKTSKDSISFDSKAFQKAHPDIYQQFTITKPGTRRFIVK